jgi:pimeloyl-ACP methyl ester carboxylesterase
MKNFVNPSRLPYSLKKVMTQTALANRKFYEKELKEICPDFLSLEKELPNIKAQTLILWGDQDKVLDVSSVPVFEKGLKNHKTVIIKDFCLVRSLQLLPYQVDCKGVVLH